MAVVRSSFTPVSAATREQLARLCRSAEDGGQHGALVSGFDELDRRLPRGGWPLGALIELLSVAQGIGELGLFLPALSRLAHSGRYIAWIAPPYLPYAPALVAARSAARAAIDHLYPQPAGIAVGDRAGAALPGSRCRARLAADIWSIRTCADCSSRPRPAAASGSCIARSRPRGGFTGGPAAAVATAPSGTRARYPYPQSARRPRRMELAAATIADAVAVHSFTRAGL